MWLKAKEMFRLKIGFGNGKLDIQVEGALWAESPTSKDFDGTKYIRIIKLDKGEGAVK